MPRTIKQRIKRRIAYRLARIIRPVILAYLDTYHWGAEDEPDSGDQRVDLTGTAGGHFEVATNDDHDTMTVWAGTKPIRLGFVPDKDNGRVR